MTAAQLKASILDQAVRGKLVPQDPNDESAAALLARIWEEKVNAEEQRSRDRGRTQAAPCSDVPAALTQRTQRTQRGAKSLCAFANSAFSASAPAGKTFPPIPDEEKPFEIPKGWVWVRLGDVVFNHGQKTPSCEFCYIDIGSIDNIKHCLNKDETILLPSQASSRARKIVQKGDVIYSCVRPYLHNIAIIDKDFSREPIASTGFAVMATLDCLYNKFLFYYLLSPIFDEYANDGDNAKGIAYPAISDSRFYSAVIPLPPLAEQKRIVAKVEELLPIVEKYGAAYERRKKLIGELPEKLRKSILQEAIQGKLVPQDPNDEPAAALLARIWEGRALSRPNDQNGRGRSPSAPLGRACRAATAAPRSDVPAALTQRTQRAQRGAKSLCAFADSAFSVSASAGKTFPPIPDDEKPFPLPKGWAWCRIGEIFSLQAGKNICADELIKNPKNSLYPCFGGNGIRGYLPFYSHEGIHAIIGRQGALCGNVQLSEDKFYATEHAVVVDTYAEMSPRFVLYFLTQLDLHQYATATAQPGLAVKEIYKVPFPLPPLAEQKRIVAKVEELLSDVERLKKGAA